MHASITWKLLRYVRHRCLQQETTITGWTNHSGTDPTHPIRIGFSDLPMSYPLFCACELLLTPVLVSRRNEQWMGWPIGPEYEDQSNCTIAHQLKGKLLIAHGDLDDNVPLPASIKLVNALIEADKDFDMLIMPGRNHGFGNEPYFTRRRWNYFVTHLMGKTPPPA